MDWIESPCSGTFGEEKEGHVNMVLVVLSSLYSVTCSHGLGENKGRKGLRQSMALILALLVMGGR